VGTAPVQPPEPVSWAYLRVNWQLAQLASTIKSAIFWNTCSLVWW